ncbi:hypothetical protein ACWJJH_14250 [Endozoicomonadaceae bacterium StTr2]
MSNKKFNDSTSVRIEFILKQTCMALLSAFKDQGFTSEHLDKSGLSKTVLQTIDYGTFIVEKIFLHSLELLITYVEEMKKQGEEMTPDEIMEEYMAIVTEEFSIRHERAERHLVKSIGRHMVNDL